jgi:hypothetical protein
LDAPEWAALRWAGKAQQRRQRAAAQLIRVCSAFTHKVMGFVCEILSVHQVLLEEVSGQLRILGSLRRHQNSRQRGTCENTNGLIRQYLPKGKDLSLHTQEELDVIADSLNNRPRAIHAFHSPLEVFGRMLSEIHQPSTSIH